MSKNVPETNVFNRNELRTILRHALENDGPESLLARDEVQEITSSDPSRQAVMRFLETLMFASCPPQEGCQPQSQSPEECSESGKALPSNNDTPQ